MVWVTLGIGSNTRPYDNIKSCLDALLLQFHDMKLSSVFESAAESVAESAAEGSADGADKNILYLNMAVGFETDMDLQALAAFVKKLESKHGRMPQAGASEQVTLDVDILTYADKCGTFSGIVLPRPQIPVSAYVLWPLSQVAARLKHPELKQTYAELWKNFSGDKSHIKPVDFEWHGRRLSSASN